MMDMGPFGGMLAGLQKRMQDIKDQAALTEVSGEAGAGLVRVVATCDQNVVSVHIAPEAMDDRELLEDLLRAATNEAMRKGREELASQLRALTGGLPLPPGLIPGL
jgi:DNA-binding YbaB/EbfC family protein